MKKVTLFLLLAISILLFGSAQVFAQSGGTGTSGDPYLISNLSDLQWLSNLQTVPNGRLGSTSNKLQILMQPVQLAITPIGNTLPISLYLVAITTGKTLQLAI